MGGLNFLANTSRPKGIYKHIRLVCEKKKVFFLSYGTVSTKQTTSYMYIHIWTYTGKEKIKFELTNVFFWCCNIILHERIYFICSVKNDTYT